MLIIKWIVAKVCGGQLVWLSDYNGEEKLTIAYQSQFGALRAEVYWPFNVRTVRLMRNGTVHGCSYIDRWKPFSENFKYPKEPQ